MFRFVQKYKNQIIKMKFLIKSTLIFLLFPYFLLSQNKYEFLGAVKLNGNDKTLIT